MSELKKTDPTKKPPEHPKRREAKPGTFKQKSFWQKMKTTFFAKTAKEVADYLWNDVLVPAIKKTLADTTINAINMTIFGNDRGMYRNGNNGTHAGNSSVYAGRNAMNSQQYNRSNRYSSLPPNCPLCTDRLMLEGVIDEINEWMTNHGGRFSVENLSYVVPDEMCFPVVYTDRNWGWTRPLTYACVVEVNPGEYVLSLPPANPLQ